ncbi:MAG TPA: hypothetical protein VHL80_09160, partial [Polyangia bacterium]|nr:hypothetical protein [Polyangia bacterium]
MSRRARSGLLGLLCAAAVACGDPEQLYRHRDAGAPPSTGAGGASGLGAPAGSGGTIGTGTG